MEAIICLPVLLLLSLGVAQFAHIWYCRTIVHYAAYCGARAVLTAPNGPANELIAARSAVEIVCAPIAFMNPTSGTTDFSLPGVTPPPVNNGSGTVIGGSGAVRYNNTTSPENNILNVRVIRPGDLTDDYLASSSYTPSRRLPNWHYGVEVEMKVPLLFPFAGQIIGQLASLWDANGNFDIEVRTPDGPDRFTGKRTIQKFAGDFTSRICLRERAYIVKPFISTWSTF